VSPDGSVGLQLEVPLLAIGGKLLSATTIHPQSTQARHLYQRPLPLGTENPNILWSSEKPLKSLEIALAARASGKARSDVARTCLGLPIRLHLVRPNPFPYITRRPQSLKQQMVDTGRTGDVVEGSRRAAATS